jgi:hypothetical protein
MDLKSRIILEKYQKLIDILDNETIKNIYIDKMNTINRNLEEIDIDQEIRYISGILAHVHLSNESYRLFEEIYHLLRKYNNIQGERNSASSKVVEQKNYQEC